MAERSQLADELKILVQRYGLGEVLLAIGNITSDHLNLLESQRENTNG